MADEKQQWITYHQIAGVVLRRIRKSLEYSQSAVAKEASMNQSSLSKIEKGKNTLNIGQLRKISLFFGYLPSRIMRAIDEEVERLQEQGVMVISDVRPSELEHQDEYREELSTSDVPGLDTWSPISNGT